ncbi:MBL fold metallo-hydrolase [Dictyobacter kobayashii]|uniref:MBL fold hydrolase n=1 Tax=Dictyobacter kobayashii TaxID=2014872 RepID=A0A402AGD5_9CHLR|nr:MBL fold metallo-hydrolase [Dictyobacter kobayashii]GCE18113.1 MBL fold hydrolase [Dictyobacter kobayashii]
MTQQPPSTSTTLNQERVPLVREVADHIWQITLPIPTPLKTVNVYALVGPTGWVLVDAAIGNPSTREAFFAGIAQAGLNLKDLQAIVLTHSHPDHIGLAGDVYEVNAVPVLMHPLDSAGLQETWGTGAQAHFQLSSQFFARHGLPPAEHWYTRLPPELQRTILHLPPQTALQPIEDGQVLELAGEDYRVIWLPGHSDGQIGLWRERDGIFLVADHVLPRITPNIGLYSPLDRPDPLADYFQSLTKVASLPAQQVLPGHGDPFDHLAIRVAEIIEHHQRRLKQIIDLLTIQPLHATQLTQQLFGDRLKSNEALHLAVAEILAHLEYLRLQKQLIQQQTQAGILYYVVSNTLP